MKPLTYVPYQRLSGRPSIVVDGSAAPGTVLTLSHWPGVPGPHDLADDLSAQMAFRYLDRPDLHVTAEAVSNNHFDQDGLVGVFALVDPEGARQRRGMLEDVAAAGDFATYRYRDAARVCMAVAAFADAERSPLILAVDHPDATAQLYEELLGRLAGLVDDPGAYRDLWEEEDAALGAGEAALAAGAVSVTERLDLDLAVVVVAGDGPAGGGTRFAHLKRQGLHPMVVANATARFCVATLHDGRYELEYRYETWVQYRSRRPRPRVDLAPAAEELNGHEAAGRWVFDGVSQLTPRLHLEPPGPSSLAPQRFLEVVANHLATGAPAWDPYPRKLLE